MSKQTTQKPDLLDYSGVKDKIVQGMNKRRTKAQSSVVKKDDSPSDSANISLIQSIQKKQNVPEIGRQKIKVASAPFKTDEKTSQNQLIEMADVMTVSASVAQLGFYKDQNEDSIPPQHKKQLTLHDVELISDSSMSFGKKIEQNVGDQEDLISSM